MVKVGLIGGSGLEDLSVFSDKAEIEVPTKWGLPSSTFYTGKVDSCEVFICSRHGRDHKIPPTQVNNRANIAALKEVGCDYILASTACGSLREEISRGDIVIPDQLIDFTRRRHITFHESFDPGSLAHAPMAEPFSGFLRSLLAEEAERAGFSFHREATLITIEGPRFSTRAESRMFRNWGADIINMSTAPEATLAFEMGLPYAVVALSTDYDSWKTEEHPVTWDEVLRVFQEHIGQVTWLLQQVIHLLSEKSGR